MSSQGPQFLCESRQPLTNVPRTYANYQEELRCNALRLSSMAKISREEAFSILEEFDNNFELALYSVSGNAPPLQMLIPDVKAPQPTKKDLESVLRDALCKLSKSYEKLRNKYNAVEQENARLKNENSFLREQARLMMAQPRILQDDVPPFIE